METLTTEIRDSSELRELTMAQDNGKQVAYAGWAWDVAWIDGDQVILTRDLERNEPHFVQAQS